MTDALPLPAMARQLGQISTGVQTRAGDPVIIWDVIGNVIYGKIGNYAHQWQLSGHSPEHKGYDLVPIPPATPEPMITDEDVREAFAMFDTAYFSSSSALPAMRAVLEWFARSRPAWARAALSEKELCNALDIALQAEDYLLSTSEIDQIARAILTSDRARNTPAPCGLSEDVLALRSAVAELTGLFDSDEALSCAEEWQREVVQRARISSSSGVCSGPCYSRPRHAMMTSGERGKAVEAMARTLLIEEPNLRVCAGPAPCMPGPCSCTRNLYVPMQAALTALHDAGYAVVPREPTDAMINALQAQGAAVDLGLHNAIAAADIARDDPDDKSTEADDA